MVITRSNSGRENSTTDTSGSGDNGTTTETGTTETGTSRTNTTSTGDTTATLSTRAERQADTSGIAATPAASTATVVERPQHELMPPPTSEKRNPKPARSRRSGTSRKKLLAGLEAKERLAELELREIRAAAALERAKQERIEAETSDSDGEEDDLAPQRVSDWFERQPEQEKLPEEIRSADAPAENKVTVIEKTFKVNRLREVARACPSTHEPKGQEGALPARQVPTIDVASLSAALAEAIYSSKPRRHVPELPPFDGRSQEWLSFKATYHESCESFTASENTARIRRSLRGVALEAVNALLISQPNPEDVINSLERRFGRPDMLLLNEIEKMKTLPRLADNPRDLCIFSSRIANTIATIEVLKRPQYLHNPEVLRLIIDKLTPILRNKWYDYAANRSDEPELRR